MWSPIVHALFDPLLRLLAALVCQRAWGRSGIIHQPHTDLGQKCSPGRVLLVCCNLPTRGCMQRCLRRFQPKSAPMLQRTPERNGKAPMKRKAYEKQMRKLQVQLCRLQAWVKQEGLRVIIVFEGRDAAGKGGTIKAITERVSPRVFRVVALPAPSDREKSQMYLQRYMQHFPAAGEVIIFDRSWYNRAGVEYVMGFCSDDEYRRFLELCPAVERYMVDGGIILIKLWLEVGPEEQEERFAARIEDPLRQWKLSPMDIESYRRWYAYSKARDTMLKATDTRHAPWYIVRSDDKRRARLNCISHILRSIPFKKVQAAKVKLPKRSNEGKYDDQATLQGRNFVAESY
jgi:polyphosphate kinase 2